MSEGLSSTRVLLILSTTRRCRLCSDALIEKRREGAEAYEEYLKEIVELIKQVKTPSVAQAIRFH